jgi:hypothetical protein
MSLKKTEKTYQSHFHTDPRSGRREKNERLDSNDYVIKQKRKTTQVFSKTGEQTQDMHW